MAKRKKKKKVEEKKQENIASETQPIKNTMPLHVYFSLKKIKQHRQAGMKVYKNAAKLEDLSMQDWDDLFKDY